MEKDRQPIWDAMVIGAGPAGCAAAYDLAAGGARVLLADKCRFPRPKACAGGLTIKSVRALRYSIEPVVRQAVTRVLLEQDAGRSAAVQSRSPICLMTVRAELDQFCLEQTMAAGAEFLPISPLRRIIHHTDRIVIATESEEYSARFLIAADGANSQIRKLCARIGSGEDEAPWFAAGFALEAQVFCKRPPRDAIFDFGALHDGYGWVFPKEDHINAGLYCVAPKRQHATLPVLTRNRLIEYIKGRFGGAAPEIGPVTGQYLGMGAWCAPPVPADTSSAGPGSRILFAGDAGGFSDPLTGEGIYGAIVSGQAAAGAILEAMDGHGEAGSLFDRKTQDYRALLRFSARAAGAFYSNPSRGFRALAIPFLKKSLVSAYAHGFEIGSLSHLLANQLGARL